MDITPDSLLTTAGAIVFAGVIRQGVEVLKAASTKLDAVLSGALAAFIFSLAAYALLFITGSDHTQAHLMLVITSWLACATAAVGINAAVDHVSSQSPNSAGTADAGAETDDSDPEGPPLTIDPTPDVPDAVTMPPADPTLMSGTH